MACNLTTGITLDCIDSLGGIKTVYVGDAIEFTGLTADADGILTAVTGTGVFYTFETPKDTATYTGTLNVAPAAGTLFYLQEVALTFHKLDADKRNALLLLAKNRDIKIIVEDNNGLFWLIGKDRGANATAGTAVSGAAPGDMNGYTITLSASEAEPEVQLQSLDIFSGITFDSAPV